MVFKDNQVVAKIVLKIMILILKNQYNYDFKFKNEFNDTIVNVIWISIIVTTNQTIMSL